MGRKQKTPQRNKRTTATDVPRNWSHGKFTADELDLTYPWPPDAGGSWVLLVLHSWLFLLKLDSLALLRLGITSFHSVQRGDYWLVKPRSWASSLPAKEAGRASVRCFPQEEAYSSRRVSYGGKFLKPKKGI